MTPPHTLGIVTTAFVASFLVAVFLVLTQKYHGRYSNDETHGVQKSHRTATPRIGGVAIVFGLIVAWAMADVKTQAILGPLLLAGFPAFVFGLAEDLTKKIGVMPRLLATFASGILGWWLTGVSLSSVDIPFLNPFLGITLISVLFTAFAIGGVANGINIIDGYNGLASGFVTLALVGVGAIALDSKDMGLAVACFALAAAFMGFWLVNWPWGKLFLGDGGSYFGGFALAWACVMLIERHPEITAFAPLLVCIHPVTEVLFSIYRRKLRRSNIGHPDRLHLHNLIMRRIVRTRLKVRPQFSNPAAGLLLALMSLPAIVVAYAVRDSIVWGASMSLVFMLGYVALYARLVRFHWCSPLAFLLFKPSLTIKPAR